MRLKAMVAAMVATGLIHVGAACAEETERELATMKVLADQDKPIQQRTELGRLTEYTPISGAVVDEEEIEHLQLVNNLLELGKRIPGISMIRNMRIPDGGKQYTENRIDGMRAINVNTSVFDEVDMSNLERLEVITGPASALYGSGALGGTISLYTKQPPRDFEAKLSQEAGSWGFLRTQASAGTSTENGRLGFIVTGSSMDNDGWRRNHAAANQDSAAEHKYGGSVKTVLRPTDTTKVALGYNRLHYDYRWAGTLRMTKFNEDWRQSEEGTYGQSIDDYETISARIQQMIGERGEFSLAYGRIIDDGLNYGGAGSGGSNNVICDDSSALLAPLAAGTTVKCRAVNNNSRTVTNTLKQDTTTTATTTAMFRQEFSLAKATLYVGDEFIDIRSEAATYNNAYTALQGQAGYWSKGSMVTGGEGSVTTENHDTPFVHFEFSPLDPMRVHLGARFGEIEYKVDDRTSDNDDTVVTHKGDVLRSGVTYELARNHLVWANWGETFNAPASSTLLDSATIGTPGNTLGANLKPEEGVTKEIGFRGLFENIGLHYDVTLFHSNNQGFVTSRYCTAAEEIAYNAGSSCKIYENAGELTAKGLESMFSWAVNSWLDLGATYTNSRVFFNKYDTIDRTLGPVSYSGNTYQAAPRERINLRAVFKPAPGWQIELEGDHISSYYIDNANTATYQRPDLFNLRASYRSRNWSFWLHALNLTDRQYATRVSYSTIAGEKLLAASAGQGNSGSYTPLTIRAGVSYKF